MGTIGLGALLVALELFFVLDGRSEVRFGRSVGRLGEGERLGGKILAASGIARIALGVIVMIAGLFALWL